jgi:hypothetical protein
MYSRPCAKGRAGIGYELRTEEVRPLWNLYWLSEPRLDEFLAGGPSSRIDFQIYRACRIALTQQLDGRLVFGWMQGKYPALFAGALATADHQHLEPFKLRGPEWIRTVISRARMCRGLVEEHGPVAFVNFGGKELNVTTARNSAKIMTLALVKT